MLGRSTTGASDRRIGPAVEQNDVPRASVGRTGGRTACGCQYERDRERPSDRTGHEVDSRARNSDDIVQDEY